ncbi:MAG TPA: hypothetical protein PLF51_07320 [Candidatus Hydrogenedentes bacterium]|nr:hypothetical protein [Candidatus Hydrogenedentota bacterium]
MIAQDTHTYGIDRRAVTLYDFPKSLCVFSCVPAFQQVFVAISHGMLTRLMSFILP